jgi:hypothetical protein
MFENRPEPVLTGFGPVQVNFGKFWTGYGSSSPQKGKKKPDRTRPLNTSASSLDSYKTAINEPLGSPVNPIIIPDNGDDICTHCYQTDHLREDCLTPIQLNKFCEACEWRGTPQEDCRHIEMAPGWLK